MKFEFRRNNNGTIDIIYKNDDITINLHGNNQEVEIAYNNIRNNYIIDDVPKWYELSGNKHYIIETSDKPEQEVEDIYNNTCLNCRYYIISTDIYCAKHKENVPHNCSDWADKL